MHSGRKLLNNVNITNKQKVVAERKRKILGYNIIGMQMQTKCNQGWRYGAASVFFESAVLQFTWGKLLSRIKCLERKLQIQLNMIVKYIKYLYINNIN